jgi:hypothetical protein
MLFAATAGAQQQDQRLMERVLNPQIERANPMATKEFSAAPFSARSFESGGPYRGVREAARPQEFGTRSFLGIRNPWFGKKVFETKAARDLTRYVLSDKAYASRSVEASPAPEARRALPVAAQPVYQRDYVVRGKAQQALSAQHSGGAPMSLDEVRELLNRNR